MTLPEFIYRDKEGNPLAVLEWGKLFEDFEYRKIKQESVGELLVSTMWIGVPQMIIDERGISFNGYFETAVLTADHKKVEMMRYETLAEATFGHDSMVFHLKTKSASQEDLERSGEALALDCKHPSSSDPHPQHSDAD